MARFGRPPAIDFAIERQRHGGFVGRADLLARLDQLLITDRADRWVVLTGGPGTGKSAVLAAWLARREAAGEMVPHHFIRRGWANWDEPEALVGSLVTQIEARASKTRRPRPGDPEADQQLAPAARMAAALQRVSERVLVPRGERLVLLIDGLDEYDTRPGSSSADPLMAFLPYALPPGVSVLCASRPRHPYLDKLAMRGALVKLDLDDASCFAADNTATVRAFWDAAAPALGVDAAFVEQAVQSAAGNLQHAVLLRQQLAGLPPEQRMVEDIPLGLDASIASAWERIATEPLVVNGLGILCAARDALTLDEIGRVADWTSEPQRRTFLGRARELLIEARRAGHVCEYRLHHDSIRTYIAGAIGSDALAAHHRALAQRLATWPSPTDPIARRYALHHALVHRVEAGEWADVWQVAADVTFLEVRAREIGVQDTEADVARVAARCRASGDEVHAGRLTDLASAFARESHWLRAAPEATGALIWNRLRHLGWNARDLDTQLRVPDDREFLRMRHGAIREHPALVLDLAGHSHWARARAVTPEGAHAVSASADKALKGREVAKGHAVATLQGHTHWVTACAVTPDGRHVVSASADQTLIVWDLASGHIVASLKGHTAWVTACAVTPDGRHVVSASADKTLKVWDLARGHAVTKLQGHTCAVNACAVTPNSRHVVSASEDQTLKVWDLASGHALATLHGHISMAWACAVTPVGQRVVSASNDKTLKVWDLASGHALATLQSHTQSVRACAVTPDGRHVVSASADKTLKVWDLASGHVVVVLHGHTSMVKACAVTPDGRHVVSASADRTLKVWDLARRHALATPHGHTHWVTACAVTPNGRHVVSASAGQTPEVWDPARRHAVVTRHGHIMSVKACVVTPDGCHGVSASADKTLKVWELASGHAVATLKGHTKPAKACAVTPDGRHVVSASADKTLKVWELASGHAVVTLKGHTRSVNACAVTPDGRHVISASADKTLKVWELAGGHALATLHGHTYPVNACAVTPDGQHAVSASEDYTLKIWELASGHAVATLRGHTGWVTACAVTPDGRHVVSTSLDKTLKVWELASGRAVATLQGHTDEVRACAVTPDGRHVVSGSDDQTLKVWELASYTCRATHRGDMNYLAIAVTANAVITGDTTGGVWLLDLPPCLASSLDASLALEPAIHQTTAPEETVMTRDELLSRLSNLLPAQFDAVVFRANAPTAYLSGANTPPATRAVELLRYVEQQNQLEQLTRIVQQVAGGAQAASYPR